MVLNLIGLGLSFIGSVGLVVDVISSIRNPSNFVSALMGSQNLIPMYDSRGIKGYIKLKKGGGYKKIKKSNREINVIVFLIILSLGFLLQGISAWIS